MDVTSCKGSKITTLSDHTDKSQREIARICGVTQSTISKIAKMYKETGVNSPQRNGHWAQTSGQCKR